MEIRTFSNRNVEEPAMSDVCKKQYLNTDSTKSGDFSSYLHDILRYAFLVGLMLSAEKAALLPDCLNREKARFDRNTSVVPIAICRFE